MSLDLSEDNPRPIDWANRARQCMRDARTLYEAHSWQSAYMSSGLAMEMALKGRIMHVQRMNSWPARRDRRELYTHNLNDLMEMADLRPSLTQEVVDQTNIGLAWLAMKDFDINSRYPTGKQFPRKLARDSVEAIANLGLLEWLMTGIT